MNKKIYEQVNEQMRFPMDLNFKVTLQKQLGSEITLLIHEQLFDEINRRLYWNFIRHYREEIDE